MLARGRSNPELAAESEWRGAVHGTRGACAPQSLRHCHHPINALNFKFLDEQIFRVADDDAVGPRVDIDDVTRARRAAGKSFALADREELNPAVFGEKIAVKIVDSTAMKFLSTEVGAHEGLVVIARNKANFLAVNFIGHPQA